MRRRAWSRLASVALAAVVAFTLGVFGVTPSASAQPTVEKNTAVADGSNSGPVVGRCNDSFDGNGNLEAIACFEPPGDFIWAYDARGDGFAAIAQWENYLKNASGNWILYRRGECRNSLTSGRWGYCNKEFYENSTYPNALGGQGSGLRIYTCAGGCTGAYVWQLNNG